MRASYHVVGLARALFQRRGFMKIRFTQHASTRIQFHPGDELIMTAMTPEVQTLLDSTTLAGEKVAHVVTDDTEDETAVVAARGETATTGRGSRRDQRSQTVPA